jgi:hypothetical protein
MLNPLPPTAPVFVTDPSCQYVFSYAIGCALNFGHSATVGPDTYSGEGLLSTTDTWQGAGLSQSQREDLHTCMITRLNPFGACVPIWLGGDHVTNSVGADPCDFPYDEAVWLATEGVGDNNNYMETYTVWPLGNLIASCGDGGNAIVKGIKTRLCGTAKGVKECHVDVRIGSLATDCGTPNAAGYYQCKLKPMDSPKYTIRTRLTLDGWNALYPCCPNPTADPAPDRSACTKVPSPPAGKCVSDPPDAGPPVPDSCQGGNENQ